MKFEIWELKELRGKHKKRFYVTTKDLMSEEEAKKLLEKVKNV